MGKRLLTTDYKRIVTDSFEIPESDLYGYYLNVIERELHYNPEIIERLKAIINNYIDWYKSIVYGQKILWTFNDGTKDWIYENQTWGTDENGNRVYNNLDETAIPLLINIGIIKQVDKAYFDHQLKVLNIIQGNIDLRQRIFDFEQQLPEPFKSIFAKNPMPDGFDYVDLKSRGKVLQHVPELMKEYLQELEKVTTPNGEKIKFHLQDFWNRAKHETGFKRIELSIKGGAILNWKGCRVYNPFIFYLFQQSAIKVRTSEGNEVEAETQPFIEYYCTGYKEGRQQFRATYPNPQQSVNDLISVYNNRLSEIPGKLPITIPYDKMYDFGFNAGELTAYYDILEQYPESFKAFTQKPDLAQKESKLSLRQIALVYFYSGEQITRDNGNSIARKYGHNSGGKLFQHFTYYSATPNRIGKPSPLTPKKLDNKIKLFESVVDLLPENKKETAIDELKTLKNHYSNEFE